MAPREASQASDKAVSRYDHQAYVRTMERAAREVADKHSDAFRASLCQDQLTREWLLTIYRRTSEHFEYTVYGWRPVEGVWKEVLESGEQPLKNWKTHFKFSEAQRDCRQLNLQ
jgi:hypothetical protein